MRDECRNGEKSISEALNQNKTMRWTPVNISAHERRRLELWEGHFRILSNNKTALRTGLNDQEV